MIINWIKYKLYPSLFEYIDVAFPELKFRWTNNEWKSSFLLNGTNDTSIYTTFVHKNKPTFISERNGVTIDLIDYIMKRDDIDLRSAINRLALVCNLSLPSNINIDEISYYKFRDNNLINEEVNKYFIHCLEVNKEAEKTVKYLKYQGYDQSNIKKMVFGFLPKEHLFATYLSKKNYTTEFARTIYKTLIDCVLWFEQRKEFATSHTISVPYRSGGTIIGFKFLSIDGLEAYYKSIQNQSCDDYLFNLSGLILEDELDALKATIEGVENVVAVGKNNLNSQQITDAKNRGVKSAILCLNSAFEFDEVNDKKYRKITKDEDRPIGFVMITRPTIQCRFKIQKAFETITKEDIKVSIANLPDLGVEDILSEEESNEKNPSWEIISKGLVGGPHRTSPGRLIKERGIESFRNILYQTTILDFLKYHPKLPTTKGLPQGWRTE